MNDKELVEYLSKLSDQQIKDEMERRGLMPLADESFCDCAPEDYRFTLDTLQKEAFIKAVDCLRKSGDFSSALVLDTAYSELC